MSKRLLGLLASAAIAISACQGATTSPAPATAAPATAPATAAPATAAPASAAPATAAPATAAPATAAPATPAPATAAPTPEPTPAGPDLTTTTYVATPAGTTGGTLVMAEWQTVSTLNPFYAAANADIEAAAPSLVWLVDVTPDLKYYPELASNVPTVANGEVVVNGQTMDVTWHLKPGQKWSDGQPITCADLEATWKWVMDPAQTGLYAGTLGWEDVTGVDGGTGTDCVVHYGKIYAAYLLMGQALLPKHYIESVPVTDAPTALYPLNDPTAGVYAGPYIPTVVDPAAQIEYVPNPNSATIYGHAPYLDKLIFKYYGDASLMVQGFRADEYDMAMDLSDSDIPQLADIPDDQKLIQDALFNEGIYFNNKKFSEKFGEADYKGIIRAIMQAIDVQAIIAGPMNGTVTRSASFVSPLLWFYKELPTPAAADPTGAAAALDALGWAAGSDGIREKGGVKLELDICTTNRQYRADAITLIASQLDKIGIRGTVKVKPALPDVFGGWNQVPDDQECNTSHGNFDIVMHGFISSIDPTSPYLVYHSKGIPDLEPHNGGNEMRISIPEQDAAWDRILNTLDPIETKAAYEVLLDIFASDENTFELSLFNHQNVWLVNPRMQNFTGNPSTATGNWNTEDWWLQP